MPDFVATPLPRPPACPFCAARHPPPSPVFLLVRWLTTTLNPKAGQQSCVERTLVLDPHEADGHSVVSAAQVAHGGGGRGHRHGMDD